MDKNEYTQSELSANQRSNNIDVITRINGYGSFHSGQSANLWGINAVRTGTVSPINRDHFGHVFFTRPDLNMAYDNLAVDRVLSTLLANDENSMARAIRVMLDPRSKEIDRKSTFVDSNQCFIPILTNSLINLSGWPDIALDTYTSKEGGYKESYSMVDGTVHIYNTFDMTASFQNIQGDPITLLYNAWVRYASLVYDGTIVPHPQNLFQNTIDYQTRIYRFVLDQTQQYVQKIACTGASFPIAVPLGNSFNFSRDGEWNTGNDQISIPFRCIGACYMDPIIIKEFNESVQLHCPAMKEIGSMTRKISLREEYDGYGHIGFMMKNMLSHKMYPRVDPATLEFEWHALTEDYNEAIQGLSEMGIISKDKQYITAEDANKMTGFKNSF